MKIVKKLMNQLSINCYGKVRFARSFIFQKKADFSTSEKNIWFLDAPEYGNLGDQAIAYAIIKYCQNVLPDYRIIEFQEDTVLQYLNWLKHSIKTSDIIVLQGGGNLGNLYPRYEYVRRIIVKQFPNNKIIIFPQSVFFSDTMRGNHEIRSSARIYSKHHKLVVFARDSVSYQEMKAIFPNTDIRLCPDIVFSLVNQEIDTQRKGIGVCLRDDKEKTVSNDVVYSFVYDELEKKYSSHVIVDTKCHESGSIIGDFREKLVIDKLREFSKAEIIVTDRLHGMIFSYIMGTPCIALGNSTGKSRYVYQDWLSDKSNVVYADDLTCLCSYPVFCGSEELDFDELEKALKDESL